MSLRKNSKKPSNQSLILARLDVQLEKLTPGLLLKIDVLTQERDRAIKERDFVCEKLVALLSPQQLEAAEISQVAPEIYALNWIELQMEKIQVDSARAFEVKPFAALKAMGTD